MSNITKTILSLLSLVIILASEIANAGEFEGSLILMDVAEEYENVGDNDPGHTEFELLEDYTFIDNNDNRWTATKGTVVNGASIPWIVWSGIGGPWSGKYRNAAVIHDYMCENKIRSSDFTHKIFYEAMLAAGTSTTKAKIMYFAVKKGGPKWEETTGFFPPVVTENGLTKEEYEEITNTVNTQNPTIDEIDNMIGG